MTESRLLESHGPPHGPAAMSLRGLVIRVGLHATATNSVRTHPAGRTAGLRMQSRTLPNVGDDADSGTHLAQACDRGEVRYSRSRRRGRCDRSIGRQEWSAVGSRGRSYDDAKRRGTLLVTFADAGGIDPDPAGDSVLSLADGRASLSEVRHLSSRHEVRIAANGVRTVRGLKGRTWPENNPLDTLPP